MDEAAIRAKLDACLLEEAMIAKNSSEWVDLPNPFPPFAFAEEGKSEDADASAAN